MKDGNDSKSASKFLLERDNQTRGSYAFDELVTMWKNKDLRPTDRIRKENQDNWTEISKIVGSLEKASATCGRFESRTNLVVGSVSLLLGLGIYLWASGHSPNMGFGEMLSKADSYIIKQPFYNIILLVSAIFGIVGAIKIVRGLQTGQK